MRPSILSFLLVSGLAITSGTLAGCTRNDPTTQTQQTKPLYKREASKMAGTQPVAGDVCSLCPEIQAVAHSGRCPQCGMKVD